MVRGEDRSPRLRSPVLVPALRDEVSLTWRSWAEAGIRAPHGDVHRKACGPEGAGAQAWGGAPALATGGSRWESCRGQSSWAGASPGRDLSKASGPRRQA